MTISTIEVAMSRIHTAEKSSPIAVFRTKVRDRVNAVYANTVATQTSIKAGSKKLIGVFHRHSNQAEARMMLRLGSGRVTE